MSWTERADLAETDAILLAEQGRLDGITPPLTAPEAFTTADLASIASELTGCEVKRIIVSADPWREAKVAQDVPMPMAEVLLGAAISSHSHHNIIEQLIGRSLKRRVPQRRDTQQLHFIANERESDSRNPSNATMLGMDMGREMVVREHVAAGARAWRGKHSAHSCPQDVGLGF